MLTRDAWLPGGRQAKTAPAGSAPVSARTDPETPLAVHNHCPTPLPLGALKYSRVTPPASSLPLGYPRVRNEVMVYLSGPITAAHGFSVVENVASAVQVYFECCRLGLPAFCPHLSAVMPGSDGIDYQTWMAIDLAVIDRCTHVVLLPRWETSPGAQVEVGYARMRGLNILDNPAEII